MPRQFVEVITPIPLKALRLDGRMMMFNGMNGLEILKNWPRFEDGEPIAVGDDVRGGDGRKWRVTGIRWGSRHPVQAVGGDGLRRDLKPEWLTHEEPWSADDLAQLVRNWCELAIGETAAVEVHALEDLAERIEGIGGAR